MKMLELWSAMLTLFLVMDPLGNVPIFLTILKDYEGRHRRRIIVREMLIALGIMAVFLFFGSHFLSFLGLKPETISIAGGIVLFLIAIKMVFPSEGGSMGETQGEPFIVPLAIPFVAGPSTLATLLLFSQNDPDHMVQWTIAMVVAWFFTALILIYSTKLYKVLGQRGLTAMERLMGMLLVMISIQMLLNGVLDFAADFNAKH